MPDPDLTQLSPAALEAWLGECEELCSNLTSMTTACDTEAAIKDFEVEAPKRLPALVRYVRTLLPLREENTKLREADAKSELFCKEMVIRCADGLHAIHEVENLRAERDALAAWRVARDSASAIKKE